MRGKGLAVVFIVLVVFSSLASAMVSYSQENIVVDEFEEVCDRNPNATQYVEDLDIALNGSQVSVLECDRLGQYEYDKHRSSDQRRNYIAHTGEFYAILALGVLGALSVSALGRRLLGGEIREHLEPVALAFSPFVLLGVLPETALVDSLSRYSLGFWIASGLSLLFSLAYMVKIKEEGRWRIALVFLIFLIAVTIGFFSVQLTTEFLLGKYFQG